MVVSAAELCAGTVRVIGSVYQQKLKQEMRAKSHWERAARRLQHSFYIEA